MAVLVSDWDYLDPVVALHLLLECAWGVVVLVIPLLLLVPQQECLLGFLALVVNQWVPCGADLGNNVGNLLLNLLSLSSLPSTALFNFLVVFLPLPVPLPLPFVSVLCADFVLGFTALGATGMHEGKCTGS